MKRIKSCQISFIKLAEKMASIMTLNYLKSEAAQAKRGDFEAFLDAVPNVKVEIGTDKIR